MENITLSSSTAQPIAGMPDTSASTVLQLPRTVQRLNALRRALQPAKRIDSDFAIERHIRWLERSVHRAVNCAVPPSRVWHCPGCTAPITWLRLARKDSKPVLCNATEDADYPAHVFGHWQSNYFSRHVCAGVRQ
jgi:hypothetical protein